MPDRDADFWDKRYDENRESPQSPFTLALHQKILELLPSDTKTILDAGCGGGALMAFLARAGKYEIEGIDLSPSGVRNVVDRLGMKAQVGDLSNLHQFADNTFDVVICSEVTEHLPPALFDKATAELFRVSRKYVITTNPYKEKLAYYQSVCGGCHTRYHPAGHIYSVDESLLRRNMEKHAESLTFHFSGKREYRSQWFAGVLRLGGYQILGNMGTACPVCGLPESTKKWSVPVRLLGYPYRAAQLTLRRLGIYSHANIIVKATVRKTTYEQTSCFATI